MTPEEQKRRDTLEKMLKKIRDDDYPGSFANAGVKIGGIIGECFVECVKSQRRFMRELNDSIKKDNNRGE